MTVVLLMFLGSAIALWQFNVMRMQSERLHRLEQQEASVLRVHNDLLAFVDRIQRSIDARSAERLAADAGLLRQRCSVDTDRALEALRDPSASGRRHTAMIVALEAIRRSVPAQADVLVEITRLGDWEVAQSHLDRQLKAFSQATADLVSDIEEEAVVEREQARGRIRHLQERAVVTLVATGVLTILLAAVLGFGVTRGITGPLRRLDTAVRALAQGEFQHVPVIGKDEVAHLGQAFNEMATDLQQLYDALRSSLNEKELLLREIHHRVKNNLQVVSSLLSLQSGYIEDASTRAMFLQSRDRLHSMALIHERLYRSKDLGRIKAAEYIRSLTTNLLRSYGIKPGRIQLSLAVDELELGIDTAIPCGLLIHELVSNALRHAFPGDRAGEVSVELRLLEREQLLLRVRDDGIGLPNGLDFRDTASLGLQLVNTLAGQLSGTVDLVNDGGTTFELRFAEPKYRVRV